MKKILQLSVLLCLIFFIALPAAVAQGYKVTYNHIDGRTLQVRLDIIDYQIISKERDGKRYEQLIIEGAGVHTEEGLPQLPLISVLVQKAPAGNIISNWDYGKAVTAAENIVPHPAQPKVIRSGDPEKAPFYINEEYFQSHNRFPANSAFIGQRGWLRDVPFVEIIFSPAYFDATTKEIKLYRSITYTLEFERTMAPAKLTSAVFEPFYKKYILNYSTENHRSGASTPAPKMLIITHDNFYNSILPYAEWKTKKGIKTTIVKTSEIAANPFYSDIKNFIQQQYNADTMDYVLLVGDYDKIPVHYGVGNSLNDHNYTLLAGNDYLSDIMIGRFSVNTAAECDIYVNKSIQYERYPVINSDDWYTSATVIASNDGVDNMNGLHMVNVFQSNGFTTIDDYRELIGTNTLTNVINSLNSGRSWLFFIGHGYPTGWSTVTPSFNNSHVDGLTAQGQIPAIVTVACANADIDEPGTESFAEKFMNAGVNKGAANVLGATEDCAFFWTDTLGKYSIIGYLDRDAETFGAALNFGKLAMYNAFPQPAGGLTQETMEQHVIIGDPTQMPWSATPVAPIVTHQPFTFTGLRDINITVYKNGSTKVANALVCLSNADKSIYLAGYTDSLGKIDFTIHSAYPDTLDVVVTGYNLLPYERKLPILKQTGIEDPVNAELVRVYPNPFTEMINFDLSYLDDLPQTLEIYDISGRKIYEQQVEEKILHIQMDRNVAGVYIYELKFENGLKIKEKIIAQ